MHQKLALFAESEKGRFKYPYFFKDLSELQESFGNPPKDSLGLEFGIQALMYEKEIFCFRVKEEGFSIDDYMSGINYLKNKDKVKNLDAICLPNVGSKEIIDAADIICNIYKSVIITTEKDLYDYLTS